jgi:hypothetical protein
MVAGLCSIRYLMRNCCGEYAVCIRTDAYSSCTPDTSRAAPPFARLRSCPIPTPVGLSRAHVLPRQVLASERHISIRFRPGWNPAEFQSDSRLSPPVGLPESGAEVVLTGPSSAVAVRIDSSCAGFKSQCSTSIWLRRTTDGGRTWTPWPATTGSAESQEPSGARSISGAGATVVGLDDVSRSVDSPMTIHATATSMPRTRSCTGG